MRKAIVVTLFAMFCCTANAQQLMIDSFRRNLAIEKSDTGKMWLLQQIGFLSPNNDSTFFYAQQALKILQKADHLRAKAYIYRTLGVAYERYGNYPMALKSYLTVLEASEKKGSPNLKSMAYSRLASFFTTQQDYNIVEYYLGKAKKLIYTELPPADHQNRCFGLLSIGDSYLGIYKPDSALKYTQQAYEVALANKINFRIPGILGQFGEIHQQMGNDGLALEYYRASEKTGFEGIKFHHNDGIAGIFFKKGETDSALHYARLALQIDRDNKSISKNSKNYFLLSEIFDKKNNIDSAYYYNKLATKIKDSIYTEEKEQQIQNLNFNEQQRQQELEIKKAAAAKERNNLIQYSLLALGIITFIIVFLLLSRSFITNEKVIKFFGIVALLIVFEFLNLLLHPFLERVTNHSPVLMLGALVAIAALLVPAHHQLEKWITRTMVEKNRKIRLDAAKKTIAALEGDTQVKE